MTILINSQTRVFLIEWQAGPENKPSYEYQYRVGAVGQGLGDETPIMAPDPQKYEGFEEIATIKGAKERVLTSLEGLYARDLFSTLLELAQMGCPCDVQVHAGACTDPQVFNSFEKAVIFEKVSVTDWGVDGLGALSSSENNVITETIDISARNIYEALPLLFWKRASSTVVSEALDITYCDSIDCGQCGRKSKGCSIAYVITKVLSGPPEVSAKIIYTDNDFLTTTSNDIDTLHWLGIGVEWNQSTDTWVELGNDDLARFDGVEWNESTDTWTPIEDALSITTKDPAAVACMGDYVVVVSNASSSLHYALQSVFAKRETPGFTELSMDEAPNDIFSLGRKAFIVCDNGYVYTTIDPSVVTEVDAGVASIQNLLRVYAITEQFAVAVGENGAIVYTTTGASWQPSVSPTADNLISVFVKSQHEWWVGSDAGSLYYSLDEGETWTEKTLPGSGYVYDIVFTTNSVAFIARGDSILRSVDGGFSWVVLDVPANDKITRLGICDSIQQITANHIVGVGLVGLDGVVVHGKAYS